jgi:sugar lactone lactonase YvrE
VGSQPYALTVSPVDASGATIVGDGAPTFTVTSGTTAVAVSSSGTDTFAVEVHGYRSAPVNLTIAPSSGSATTIALTTVQEMWVSHYTTNTVVAYGLSATPAQITTDTITAGLATPVGVAVDASGNVWIANSFSNSVAAYVPGTSTPIAGDTITAGLSLPEDLAFDASGHLWVANHNGNNVTAYTVSPTPVQITADTITAGLTTPAAVAFDASGILWVGNQVSTTINAYAPGTNSVITADMISPVVNNNIRFDATGRLWVANQSTGAVSAYAPGTSAPTSGDTIPGTGPAGAIAFSP